MTLSMAAKHPFGYFKNVPSFGPVQESVLFCCDSRVTTGQGYSDDCQKLFKLSGNSGLACAGDAKGHLLALHLMKQRLFEEKNHTSEEILTVILDCYKESVSRGSRFIMTCLIGVFDHEIDRARLFRLKSDGGITMEEIVEHDIYCIGPTQELIEWYGYTFTAYVDSRLKKGAITDSQLEWLTMMAVPFEKQFIGEKWSKYVGGLVQTALLDQSGYHMVNRLEIKLNGTDQEIEILKETKSENGIWNQFTDNRLVECTLNFQDMLKRFI